MDMSPFDILAETSTEADSLLCVGLDPSASSLCKFYQIHQHIQEQAGTKNRAEAFCRYLIDETHDLVCCYKLNTAFFEALGVPGVQVSAAA